MDLPPAGLTPVFPSHAGRCTGKSDVATTGTKKSFHASTSFFYRQKGESEIPFSRWKTNQ